MPVDEVQVRMAQTTRFGVDQHLVRAGLGIGDVGDFEPLAGCFKNGGFCHKQTPFALSLSKGRSSFVAQVQKEKRCFDKLSTNGSFNVVSARLDQRATPMSPELKLAVSLTTRP
jgi:hypothetical protein